LNSMSSVYSGRHSMQAHTPITDERMMRPEPLQGVYNRGAKLADCMRSFSL
jgi:hypothetical protein